MRRLYERQLRRTLGLPTVSVDLVGAHGLTGLKIALVSDLHAGSYLGATALEAVAQRVSALEPDLVCLPGDLINSRPEELGLLPGFLRALRAPLGVFAVPGNHDHTWCPDMAQWVGAIEATGVRVLLNRGTRLSFGDSTIWLAGVDDYAEGAVDLERALDGRRLGEPCVLLAHQPDFFAESLRADVDLTLSGHTHGGQVRVGSWAPMRHTRFDWLDGHFEIGGRHLVVSRGIGATLLPLRLGAPPEVPILTIR